MVNGNGLREIITFHSRFCDYFAICWLSALFLGHGSILVTPREADIPTASQVVVFYVHIYARLYQPDKRFESEAVDKPRRRQLDRDFVVRLIAFIPAWVGHEGVPLNPKCIARSLLLKFRKFLYFSS